MYKDHDRTSTVPKVIAFKRRKNPGERFETLLQPHFEALYAAARRMTLSPYDAEDLVQEVCIKAFDRLDELEKIEYPRAWLLKVMYNLFIDSVRAAGRSPVDVAGTGDDSAEPDRLDSGAERPEDQVERNQRIEQILRAMRCLNAEQCALVAMHDIEGLSIDELSRLTGQPAGTIKSQLHRTRKKLGRLLSNEAVIRPQLRLVGGKQ